MKLSIWLKAIRIPFFTATVIPIVFGSILAWYDSNNFSLNIFWLTLLGGILMHAGTNLSNDYFDHRSGCDEANATPTPFSGGSRVIQDGFIAPKKILIAALVSFALGGMIGLYLNYLSKGNVILIIGAIGVFLAFFYTAKPIRIGYGTFGELAVGIGFGPLMVAGAYYVQAQRLPSNIFLLSVPIGILIALVLFINEFPDEQADKAVDKKTLVVVLGRKNAMMAYHILLASVYIFVLSFVLLKILPSLCLAAFLTIPIAVKTFIISRRHFDKINELLPANAATIGLHALIGLLLCAGIFLDKIFL